MKKRSFTKEEKLKIIKEASENGVHETLEKYGIYRASYYDWKKKFEQMGEEGFTHGMTPAQQKRIRELEKENNLLKQLLAEKELENKLKADQQDIIIDLEHITGTTEFYTNPLSNKKKRGGGGKSTNVALTQSSIKLILHHMKTIFKQKKVIFSIKAPEDSIVEIAGDFTNWLESPLQLQYKENNVYECKVRFRRSGTFQYKYRINGDWAESIEEIQPKSKTIPNAFGTSNFFIDINLWGQSSKQDLRTDQKTSNSIFDEKAYAFLIECSRKKNFTKWNEWREQRNDEKINLRGANLTNSNLEKFNLSNINFENSDFSSSFLSSANFDSSNLRNTNFRKAWFSNGSAKNANFSHSDMRDSTIDGTRFSWCNMIETDLKGVSAKYVNIQGTNLHHAKIESADFSYAIVDGETLIDTTDIDRRTLFTSVGLSSARLKSGLLDTLNYNIRRNRWEEWYKVGTWNAKIYKNLVIGLFWKISDYGRSTKRIIYVFLSLVLVFGLVYWFHSDIITNMNNDDVVIKAFHTVSFSIVTMITLGFGSMNAAPASLLGHIMVALQIIAGYAILAALVSRIAIMFDSDGPDIEHKPLYEPHKDS